MKKTNLNLKRKRFYRNFIIILVVWILASLLLILDTVDTLREIDGNKLTEKTIIVDSAQYHSHPRYSTASFQVVSDSKVYVFRKRTAWTDDLTFSELSRTIKKGDELAVKCIGKTNIIGMEYYVVFECERDGVFLHTLDTYNELVRIRQSYYPILVVLFELVCVTPIVIYAWWNYKVLNLGKLLSKKKK